MAIVRTSSGLLLRDDFGSDTLGSYTISDNAGDWSITGGELVYVGSSEWSMVSRPAIDTAKVFTCKVKLTSDVTDYYDYGLYGAYFIETSGSNASKYSVYDALASELATIETATRTINVYHIYRLYILGGHVYTSYGATELAAKSDTTNGSYTAGYPAFGGNKAQKFDWVDARSAITIICTGMSSGHYLRVSDGTTAAEAQESGGTATVNAGLVLFPLATVQIRSASGGGGDLIEELGTGDYADMGGGDVFEYSAGAAGIAIPLLNHLLLGD